MAAEVIMPKLGMTMEEGEIVKWHKEEGEKVQKGEVLLEVLSDKATFEVEAPSAGILLSRRGEEGESIPVTEVIAYIGEEWEEIEGPGAEDEGSTEAENEKAEEPVAMNEDVPVDKSAESDEDKKEKQKETGKSQQPTGVRGKVKASPAARRLARENGLDLSSVNPTGPGERIIENDVYTYLEKSKSRKATTTAENIAREQGISIDEVETEGSRRVYKQDVLSHLEQSGGSQQESEKMSAIRKAGARQVSKSWHSIPHVTITAEVDMKNTLALCQKMNEHLVDDGIKVTVTDILLKVTAKVLQEYPLLNARLEEEEIHYYDNVNIGLAVAVDDGLLVPVIKDVDKKGLKQLVKDKQTLIEKARNSKLAEENIKGGHFTISNLGMYGIDIFTPIINHPEAGILGVGQVNKKPVVCEDKVVIRPMMWLSLSFDHRLLDGVPAAKFLRRMKELLEEPELLII